MNDWNEVVEWLVTGGAVAVAAWFVSWFLEGFAWWDRQQSKLKTLLILVLALLIGLLATWVRLLPPEELEPYLPYLNVAILTVIAWLGSQVAHRVDGKKT
jgi:uncharacterized membrane protein